MGILRTPESVSIPKNMPTKVDKIIIRSKLTHMGLLLIEKK